MTLSNMRQVRKIEAMSQAEKEEYFSTARRVTIGTYQTIEGRAIKTYYAAKIRGVVIGHGNEWKHENPYDALKYGQKVLRDWRAKYKKENQS